MITGFEVDKNGKKKIFLQSFGKKAISIYKGSSKLDKVKTK